MTQPYYQDEHVTLFHGRQEDIDWQSLADVLIVDPPYGDSYRSNSQRETLARSIANDTDTAVRDAILAGWERPALVFGTWKVERPVGVKMLLVWDKGGALGMGDLSIPWKPGHEEIYVLGPGPWQGRRTNDVLRFPPVQSIARNGRVHPNQKPIPLMQELISKTAGRIADPTCGSGSTLVAAKALGRHAVGVELSEEYCEVAASRLERTTLPLFADEHPVPTFMSPMFGGDAA